MYDRYAKPSGTTRHVIRSSERAWRAKFASMTSSDRRRLMNIGNLGVVVEVLGPDVRPPVTDVRL